MIANRRHIDLIVPMCIPPVRAACRLCSPFGSLKGWQSANRITQ